VFADWKMIRPDRSVDEERQRTEIYLKGLVYLHGIFDLLATWMAIIALLMHWFDNLSKPFALFVVCFVTIINVQALLFTLVVGCIQRDILLRQESRHGLSRDLVEAFSTLFWVTSTLTTVVVLLESLLLYYWSSIDSFVFYFSTMLFLNGAGFLAVVMFGARVSRVVPELGLSGALLADDMFRPANRRAV